MVIREPRHFGPQVTGGSLSASPHSSAMGGRRRPKPQQDSQDCEVESGVEEWTRFWGPLGFSSRLRVQENGQIPVVAGPPDLLEAA